MPDRLFYDRLYLLQDVVLTALSGQTDFYLTGGTAISRFHYGHRYSDNLDFFLSYSQDFRVASRKVISTLTSTFPFVNVALDTETFIRVFVGEQEDFLLKKVELIHDVEFHFGEFTGNDVYHRIDNPSNILSNKLCALSRNAPKDVSDIIAICGHEHFFWPDLFADANEKETWVNVIACISVLSSMDIEELTTVEQGVDAPDAALLQSKIEAICRDMAQANNNSLFQIS